MAKRRANRGAGRRAGRGSSPNRRSSSGAGQIIAGLAVVVAILAGGTFVYRHTTGSPGDAAVAPHVGNSGAPLTARTPASSSSVTPAATAANPHREQDRSPVVVPPSPAPASASRLAPFGTSEEVFEGGARLYAANCAGCHGRPGRNAKGPAAAQFWDHGDAAGAHAIAQPVGAIYQATAMGNLVQGMPSYGQRLTDTQLWDVALLLKSAHEDLPEPVLRLLQGGR